MQTNVSNFLNSIQVMFGEQWKFDVNFNSELLLHRCHTLIDNCMPEKFLSFHFDKEKQKEAEVKPLLMKQTCLNLRVLQLSDVLQ